MKRTRLAPANPSRASWSWPGWVKWVRNNKKLLRWCCVALGVVLAILGTFRP